MLARTRRVAHVLGIPIYIHLSWLIGLGVVTWSVFLVLSGPELMAPPAALTLGFSLLMAVLIYGCVVGHELAHAVVARRRGMGVSRITLFVFGGVAELESEMPSPGTELLVAVAGPAFSAGLGGLLVGAAALQSWSGIQLVDSALLAELGGVNLALAVFNLVPGYPMDGGRVLRAAIWKLTHSLGRATAVASGVGVVVALGLVLVAVMLALSMHLTSAIWLTVLAGFQGLSALNGRRSAAQIRERETWLAALPRVGRAGGVELEVTSLG